MRRAIIFLLPFLAGPSLADEQSEFDRTMKQVASDLSALHDELQAVYAGGTKTANYPFLPWKDISDLKGLAYIEITMPAHIYKGADVSAGYIQSVTRGDKFRYVDKVSDWYAIALNKPIEGFHTGWVQAAQAVPVWFFKEVGAIPTGAPSDSSPPLSQVLYKKIVDSVSAVRANYAENPHIAVTGFSVDVGLPPSVSVQFEFR